MRIPKRKRFLIIAFIIGMGITALAALSKQNQPLNQQRAPEDNPGPVVNYSEDYSISSIADPKERAIRQTRGSRYDKRESFPLGKFPPNMTQYSRNIHWEKNMPALPTNQSDVVALGEVTDAKAYLSNDKSGVYSEFTIHIEEVLKNHASSPLKPDSYITTEREGGVVQFDTGRLLRYKVWHQGLPRVGHQYVFFLENNESGKDYLVVTGYEIHNNRVSPLDGQGEETGKYLPFARYDGFNKENFLNAVRESIANPAKFTN